MSADDFGVGDLFRNLAAETQAAVARDTAPYYRRFHGMRDELLERLDNRIHPLVRARSRSHQCARLTGCPRSCQLVKVFGEQAAFDIISAAMLEGSESNDNRLAAAVDNLYRSMEELMERANMHSLEKVRRPPPARRRPPSPATQPLRNTRANARARARVRASPHLRRHMQAASARGPPRERRPP